jgi:hypothetical protein
MWQYTLCTKLGGWDLIKLHWHHTRHALQPFDVACFKPFNTTWFKAYKDAWTWVNKGKGVRKKGSSTMNVFSFQENTLSIEHVEGVEDYWNMVAWSKMLWHARCSPINIFWLPGDTQGLSDIWRLKTTNETHMELMLKNPFFPCSYISGFLTLHWTPIWTTWWVLIEELFINYDDR